MDPSNSFPGFKVIEAIPFSRDALSSLTVSSQIVEAYPQVDPTIHIAALLESLDCKTIIIEREYTDRDYKAEFSAVYSKRFYVPPARCDRLHFLTLSLKAEEFIAQVHKIPCDTYLGYCIVRPTEFNRFGRTIIRAQGLTPYAKDGTTVLSYITCQASFRSHVFGREFQVNGFPFLQQDTQVGACAQASLWMAVRYMFALGLCHEFSPTDVNLHAKARQPRGRSYPAEQGLVTTQMLDALHAMGLYAIHYNKSQLPESICGHIKKAQDDSPDRQLARKLADLVYRYVESRLPVILTFKNHAVVALGHTLQQDSQPTNNIDQIPSILIANDGVGPYVELPILRRNGETYCFEDVSDIIALLPGAVMLTGEFAEESARSALEHVAELIKQGSPHSEHTSSLSEIVTNCWLRTYLIRSPDLQNDFSSNSSTELPFDAITALIKLDYPQYVWVTEVYGVIEGKAVCRGTVILDSTAAKAERSAIAVVIDQWLILFDRKKPDNAPYCLNLGRPCIFAPRPMANRDVLKRALSPPDSFAVL